MNRYPRSIAATAACLASMFAFVLSSSSIALDVSGVKVDEKIRVSNQELVLNGSGIRYAAAGLARVYVASLYLPQKRASSAEMIALKGPKRMRLQFLREVNANDFSKGLLTGLRGNVSITEQQQHFDDLLKLGNIFGQVPSVKKGDSVEIDSVPGTGTVVYVNGKRVAEVFKDESFFFTILQIWLGAKPIESTLKPVLLGLTPSNDNSLINNRDRDRY